MGLTFPFTNIIAMSFQDTTETEMSRGQLGAEISQISGC